MGMGPRGVALAGWAVAIGAWAAPVGFVRGEEPPTIEAEVRPFLARHCVKCHGAAKPKGGVDLSGAVDAPAVRRGRKAWRGVIGQVESLEMPPSGEPEVPPELRERVVRRLREAVASVDCGDPGALDPGPTPARRLTRREYDRTLRDLLGVDLDSASAVGMPSDGPGPGGPGFANLAEALILPPTLMEKYLAAADKALDLAFARPEARAALLADPIGPGLAPREAARAAIARFLRRAYRRPVDEGEVGRYLTLFDRSTTGGAKFEDSARLMFKAALVSPHFLFRVERDRGPAGSGASYPVGDHELAVRLSYFLWGTMPDEALSGLADRGRLSDPAERDRQARRMLADPRSRALTGVLAEEWLQVGRLAEARPTTEFFPTFTPKLRQDLREETGTFLDKIREEDRSVLEVLDADYAYLNADLAAHYGIAGVEGPALRRVALPAGSHRGGILGMGSFLAMTSHASRTSPTLRGKYVLEVILGTPPPPPPPDAGRLPDDSKGGEAPSTFREQMARHARQAECAGCHARIDPLGYGLEDFDAVGRWRSEDHGRPPDSAGTLPGGVSFRGPDELKRVLVGRRDEFERNLIERVLCYALGREPRGDDECAVRAIQGEMARSGHRFSDLVVGVIRSVPFTRRRDADDREPRTGDRP